MRKALLFIGFVLCYSWLLAQDRSNKGKEFWLGYGNNVLFDNDFPVNSQNLVLYLSAEEATEVTVTINGTSWSRQVNLPANTVDFSIQLPKNGPDDCRIISEGLFERGIHIVSSNPIVVYAHQFATQLSGATMLMPVETYGYTYYSINYSQPSAGGGTPGKSWFFVVASEDNTTLQITPSDTTEAGRLPNQPFTVNLKKGELYNVFGKITGDISKDLTGSKIVSITGADGNCHPVAVFSGNSRFIVCNGDGGEIAQQQIFPASAWGTRYLSYHSFNMTSNPLTTPFLNFYRVAVSDPAAVVKRNGVVLTGLQKNFYYEFQSTSGDYIESDLPVMVCQYTPSQNQCTGTLLSPQGDPELFFLPPIEQNIKKATIYNTRNANVTITYLTVIIPNNGIGSLKIDGATVPASSYATHPTNSDYTVVAKRLLGAAAQHTIESDSAFSAMLYGTGFWESYGYIAGTLVNNLNSIGGIHNKYNETNLPNTFTCPNSPVQFSIQAAYRLSALEWKLSEVNALSPARDTMIINPVPTDSQRINGRKYFTYTLNSDYVFNDTGIYYIPVNYSAPDIDNCNQKENVTVTVAVKKGPVSDFSVVYPGCMNDTAWFTATPVDENYTLTKYVWYYGDNTIDSALHSKKKFVTGDHPVTLRVIANNGCLDDTTKTITTFPQPIATFSYDRNVCLGDSIHFIDKSFIATGALTTHNWDFGDGTAIVLPSADPFFHAYAATGTYKVSLTVTSDRGCTSDSFTLSPAVNNKPVAFYDILGKLCVDSSIRLSPVITSNGNTIQSWEWDFGDGTTFSAPNGNPVTHAYTSASVVTIIKFVVSGGTGCVSDPYLTFLPPVHANPIARFTITSTSFCTGQDIVFMDAGSSPLTSWVWDFGNGVFAGAAPVTRKYDEPGTYNVQLRVSIFEGCSSEIYSQPLTINATPGIDAGPDIFLQEGKQAVINASISNPSQFQYLWTPADFLNNNSILNPVTSTPSPVVYTILASGPGGCSALDSVRVIVFKEVYIPNAFSPNGDGHNDVWNIPALQGSATASVMIYNRWGQQVFQSRGRLSPWDGTLKGAKQPMGAYYYVVQPDINEPKKLYGSIMLIR